MKELSDKEIADKANEFINNLEEADSRRMIFSLADFTLGAMMYRTFTREEKSEVIDLYEVAKKFLNWYDCNSWCRPDVMKDEWIQYFPYKNQYLPPITINELFDKFISEK